jgi:hypothetical protein
VWFFQFNNRQNGPIDTEVVKDLLAKHTLSKDTLVWKDGMNGWDCLSNTELAALIPSRLPPPINPTIIEKQIVQPPPIPTTPATTSGGESQEVQSSAKSPTASHPGDPEIQTYDFLNSPKGIWSLWLWSAILLGVGFGLVIYGKLLAQNQYDIDYPQDFSSALIVGNLIIVGGAVLWCILFFKSWAAIQDGKQKITPGKAVGFLFIPIFNYYWQFVAIHGLGKQLNRYCSDRGIAGKQVNEQLTLAQCIIFCTLWVPYLNIVTGIIFLIIFIIVWKSVAETVALIVATKQKSS